MKAWTRRLFVYGTWAMLVLVIGQFVAAGFGVFALFGPNPDGPKGTSFLMYHAGIGPAIVFLLALVMVALGFIGRLPWRMTGLAAAFIGLVILQSLLLVPYHLAADSAAWTPYRFISGLHVVNALVIFWLALEWPFWTRRDFAAAPVPSEAQAPPVLAGSA